ncbi:MAG: YfhL family 4Fe-4S dicluster ferredoxin [Oligoflexia bacterium]|nr:YfhL family 4Fe-4S dicluster ferredoxin [Oligoflexia bacterium]
MSYKITSDCNSCGACEPECPNTAISAGDDVYVINAEACTECVGFNATPQCAAVCPVDACVTDEGHVESEGDLITKAKKLHPGKDFSGAVPSHFSK